MTSVLAISGRLVLGALAVIVIASLNGGYVYRTRCPLPSGSSETSWTWGISDLIPFIRQTSPPCKAHTATRIVISSFGLFSIHDKGSNEEASPVDIEASKRLKLTTFAIDNEFRKEKQLVAPVTKNLQSSNPETRRLAYSTFEKLLRESTGRMRSIQDGLRGTPAKDSILSETQSKLDSWISLELAADAVYGSSSGNSYKQQILEIEKKISPINARLRVLSEEVQAEYPAITSWEFLSN